MGFAAFVFGQSTDVQLKTKFLTLLAEDIAREKQRVGKISFPDTKEGSIMQIFKVGGSWVVTFSIRDRADRDIFRRILGEQVIFVFILFVKKDDYEAPDRTKKDIMSTITKLYQKVHFVVLNIDLELQSERLSGRSPGEEKVTSQKLEIPCKAHHH